MATASRKRLKPRRRWPLLAGAPSGDRGAPAAVGLNNAGGSAIRPKPANPAERYARQKAGRVRGN